MIVDDHTATYRAVTIGESSVGKTCIVNRFIRGTFNLTEPNTVGATYDTYTEKRDDLNIELQIWDTAGQERFRSLSPAYFRGANAAIAVFDLTKRSTFSAIPKWIETFKAAAGPDALVFIVGNKCDLNENDMVGYNEAEEWCKSEGYTYTVTSAKTGEKIPELFKNVIDALLAKGGDGSKIAEIKENKDDCNC